MASSQHSTPPVSSPETVNQSLLDHPEEVSDHNTSSWPMPRSATDTIEDWPVANAAAGWVDRNGNARRSPDADRVFNLASVTKPLFAYAVLVAIEEGTLAVEQMVDPPGATIGQLLSHAGGLPFESTKPIVAPATRRIYSNTAFAVVGEVLAEASGMDFATYVELAVVEPLGMTATTVGDHPAHGARSNVNDLLKLSAEWLRPTLIHPDTMAMATTAQYPDLVGVLPGFGRQDPNPWGLGFEIRDHKSPHWTGADNSPQTFGHFGQAGTMVWVDPVAGVAAVALADRAFGPWAAEVWPAFSDAVLAEAARLSP